MTLYQPIVICLLLANLIATIWFGLLKDTDPQSDVAQTAKHELPSVVNAYVVQKLYDQFAKAFNAGDYDALYDMLGQAAKAQISKEAASLEFRKLTKFFGSIENGGFSHSELVGTQGNTNIYVLYYPVTLPKDSEFGESATLNITLAVQSNDYQVYGFRLHAG